MGSYGNSKTLLKLRDIFKFKTGIIDPLFVNTYIIIASYGLVLLCCIPTLLALTYDSEMCTRLFQLLADAFVPTTVSYVIAAVLQNCLMGVSNKNVIEQCQYSLSLWTMLIAVFYIVAYGSLRITVQWGSSWLTSALFLPATVFIVLLTTHSIEHVARRLDKENTMPYKGQSISG